jgi:predicted nuclease with TOPRIM domain
LQTQKSHALQAIRDAENNTDVIEGCNQRIQEYQSELDEILEVLSTSESAKNTSQATLKEQVGDHGFLREYLELTNDASLRNKPEVKDFLTNQELIAELVR